MERVLITSLETMESRELPAAVALAGLSATVALAFGRVFESDRYVAPVLAAALLPHAIGLVMRWRRANDALTWSALAVGLLAYVLLLVPGTGSPGALVDRVQDGVRVIERDAVPIRATDGAILLAVLVVWVVAALADDLAFARRASLGALAPGVMVLIWVAALGQRGGQWLTVGAFGVAGVVFLAAQHQILLDQRRTRLGPRRLFDAPRLLMAGAFIGVLAVTVGVVAAPALPGGERPLFQGGIGRGGSNDSYRTNIPPLLDVGDKLRQGQREELFTVRASSADYWRIVALDEYHSDGGGQWTLTAQGAGAVGEGLDEARPGHALTQRYRIGPLDERWMPAAYRPVQISQPNVLVVRASNTLVTGGASVRDTQYSVVSDTAPFVLTAAQHEAAAGAVPASLGRYTRLPTDFPESVRTLAQQVTAGRTNPYDKAQALRDYFRGDTFEYDPNVQLGDDEAALVAFLRDRRGFCVQFATAFATMARAVGIPTRVAVGFTPGTLDRGVYRVTNFDAHAWPEIWLAGIGWTHAFDPTPPSDLPGGSSLPGEPPPAAQPQPVPDRAPTPATTPPTAAGGSQPSPASNPGGGATVDPGNPASGAHDEFPWLVALLLVVLVLGIAPAGLILVLKARRRARRRAASDPAAAIAGAWAEAIDDLSDRRVVWPPSDTPREVAERVPQVTGADTAVPLRALADSYGAVRYGQTKVAPHAAVDAWRHVDALRSALDASSSRLQLVRARLDPATLRRGPPSWSQPRPAGWSDPRSPSTND